MQQLCLQDILLLMSLICTQASTLTGRYLLWNENKLINKRRSPSEHSVDRSKKCDIWHELFKPFSWLIYCLTVTKRGCAKAGYFLLLLFFDLQRLTSQNFSLKQLLPEHNTRYLNVVMSNEMMLIFQPRVLLRVCPVKMFWKPKTCEVPDLAMHFGRNFPVNWHLSK